MASLEDVERKQKAMQPLLEQIAQETNPDRVQELGKRIAEMANELGQMATGLEKAYARAAGDGETRVVLTKEQRQRVAEATGVALDALVLEGKETWDPQMPKMSPATIERLAMASVAARKLDEEKRNAARAIVKQLETAVGDDPGPETKAAIDQFKRDHLAD
jgi:hypothetical protein